MEFAFDAAADEVAGIAAEILNSDGLAKGGRLDQLLDGSRRFGVGLGERLKDRIYQRAVPDLAQGLHNDHSRRHDADQLDSDVLHDIDHASLLLL